MGSHGGCRMSEKEEEEYERFFYGLHLQFVIFRCIKSNPTKIYFCLGDSSLFVLSNNPRVAKESNRKGPVGRKQGRDRS